jgi:hypothetical protein
MTCKLGCMQNTWLVLFSYDLVMCSLLTQNLAKALKHNRDYSLKSILRVRATCSPVATVAVGRAGYNESSLQCEAFSPKMTMQLIPIAPIPLRCVPPVTIKTQPHAQMEMGYLTLDETRKMVPLSSSDSSVSRIPCVGAWVYVHVDVSAYTHQELVYHPYIFGACVRYMEYAGIGERVYVGGNCFLLVTTIL